MRDPGSNENRSSTCFTALVIVLGISGVLAFIVTLVWLIVSWAVSAADGP